MTVHPLWRPFTSEANEQRQLGRVSHRQVQPGVLTEHLEAVGFRLIFSDEVSGAPHRQCTLAEPNCNVHLWNCDADEPRRHAAFVVRLRSNEEDRRRYADAKRAAVSAPGSRRYNDLKAAVVYDIYERIFAADPTYEHEAHPRLPAEKEMQLRAERDRR